MGNAIKFTDSGQVVISVKSTAINSENVSLHFEVTDTGIGIPEKIHKKLFEKFTQGDSSNTRKYGGTGLGLAICFRLVELMGGEIGVKSKENKGSTFWFTLNLPLTNSKLEEKILLYNSEYDLSGTHILVAEDNHINQIMISQMLKMIGCTVDIAKNGAEAVEMVRQNEYDLVLMDCMMPKMSGYEATKTIRRIENDKNNIIIIALTANALQEDKQKCLDSGMSDYLSKPIKKPELQAMITKWLQKDFSPSEKSLITAPIATLAKEREIKYTPELSDILEIPIFDFFLEIVGKQAVTILNKHCKVARGYLITIQRALEEQDYNTMANTAHPLKSSSQYIGAIEIAEIASQIEQIGRTSTPDIFVLQNLVRQLDYKQNLLEQVISLKFTVRKNP